MFRPARSRTYPLGPSMLALPLIIGFLVSLAATFVLVPLVRQLSQTFGWLDAPDGVRKRHARAVPNVGGLAIVGAAGVGMAAALGATPGASLLPSPFVVLGALGIAAVGFWDDLRDLSYRSKFVGQLAVTALAFLGGARVGVFDAALGDGALALLVSAILTAVWMVGVMNAVNLIDGMDGLAAGVVAIALAGLAFVHATHGDVGGLVLVAVVSGALLGFLRFNFAPASIFMGDSGSLFLGYVLAAHALSGTAHATHPVLALTIPAVVMGVPVLDLLVSMARRQRAGLSLFYPDSDHLHHRLQARMPTHRAALVLYGLGTYFALGGALMAATTAGVSVIVFCVGSLGVYGFLVYTGYFSTPAVFQGVATRRRETRLRQVEQARRLRGGRVASDRFQPASAPER